MKTLLKVLIPIAIITFFSCDNDDDATNNVCDTNYINSTITDIFSTVANYDDLPEYMDLETHEYQVKINTDGEICSIGYQNPSTWTGSYTMEVINETSNASYSGTHTFSQGGLDYQSITPVPVSSGDIISVKRTISGHTSLNQTVGRILRKSDYTDVPYPLTLGNIKFLSSNFYDTGANGAGPIPDFGQPYIPFGFKVN